MVNEYFLGSIMSVQTADKFALEHIAEDVIEEDKILMDKKYWDYKMWHPTVATHYFVHRYHTIAAAIIKREVGVKEALSYATRHKSYDLGKQKLAVIRGFWKARMAADAIGCGYDVYIRAAIKNFRENYRKVKILNRQYMPLHTQLTSDFVLRQAIMDWGTEKKARFPMPSHVDIPNNDQLWFRPEMESWIIEEANKTGSGAYYIKKARETGIILGGV